MHRSYLGILLEIENTILFLAARVIQIKLKHSFPNLEATKFFGKDRCNQLSDIFLRETRPSIDVNYKAGSGRLGFTHKC